MNNNDVYSVIPLYLVNLFVIILGLIRSYRGRKVYICIWLSIAVFHIGSLVNIQKVVYQFEASLVNTGQVYMIIANSIFLVSLIFFEFGKKKYSLPSKKTNFHIDINIKDLNTDRFAAILFCLCVLNILWRFKDGGDVLNQNWQDQRDSAGLIESIAVYIGMILFSSILIFIKQNKVPIVCLLLSVGLIYFQLIGSRAMLVCMGLSIIIDILLFEKNIKKQMRNLIFTGVSLLGLHTFTRFTRNLGLAFIFGDASLDWEAIAEDGIDFTGGESGIYDYFYALIDINSQFYPYNSLITPIRLALIYFPGSWLKSIKPDDITYQIWIDIVNSKHVWTVTGSVNTQEIPGTLQPTVWGDAYANLGILGIFLYPVFLALFVLSMEKFLKSTTKFGMLIIAPIVGNSYLMIARGNVVIGFGYIAYAIPLIFLISHFSKIQVSHPKEQK
jgi:hypothetical protein